MVRLPHYIAFAALLGATACGSSGNNDNNASSSMDAGPADTGAAIDMGQEAEEDMAPAFVCPNEGEKVCGDRCVNVLISMDHCGECDNSCIRGEMTCAGESGCECLGGDIMCDGRCFDPDTTRNHCGDCTTVCPSSDACVDGACIEISTNPMVLGVLDFSNRARSQQQDCGVNGLKPAVGGLQLNDELNVAAQGHAEDMAANNFMEHVGSDGSELGDRTSRAGYGGSRIAENLARGYTTPEAAVDGWIDSDGHCQNLMGADYNELGVGHAISQSTGEHFWVQVFGRR